MQEETEIKQDETQEQSSGSAGNVDWEARFKGLQATLEKEKKAHKATQEKLQGTVGQMTTELQDLRDSLSKLTGERDSFKTQVTDLLGQKTSVEQEAATSKKQLLRLQKIVEVNPELVSDFKEGLLRTDIDPEAEEFDNFLKKYNERFGNVAREAKKEVLTGATQPGGSARQAPASKQDLRVQALDALQKGDRQTYESLMDQFYKAK